VCLNIHTHNHFCTPPDEPHRQPTSKCVHNNRPDNSPQNPAPRHACPCSRFHVPANLPARINVPHPRSATRTAAGSETGLPSLQSLPHVHSSVSADSHRTYGINTRAHGRFERSIGEESGRSWSEYQKMPPTVSNATNPPKHFSDSADRLCLEAATKKKARKPNRRRCQICCSAVARRRALQKRIRVSRSRAG
jgi:hypothetical protein